MSAPEIQNETELSLSDSPPPSTEASISIAEPNPPLTNTEKPLVLIVGAGIGGLMLGNLLQKGNIPYLIFERAKEVKPLGSGMSMGSSIAGVFQQIGIYDGFLAISKPTDRLLIYSENLDLRHVMDFTDREKAGGSPDSIVARPDLYDLLLRQIPKENLHMGKKILSFLQDESGVTIQCSDNQTHRGHILVGADGAYSVVRQRLYHDLKGKKQLPKADDVPLPCSCVCLVGQTEVLDPEEFPDLKLPLSKATALSGLGDTYKWTNYITAQNTICWCVIEFLDKNTSRQDNSFRDVEWGPEAAEAMCKQVRDFKVPIEHGGGIVTIGDLIDRTPKGRISKVMLEEKVFDTWYNGRIVLLGDACHKLNPSGGVGALTAMHDAVALANWICALEPRSLKELEVVFKEYHSERYPVAKELFATSQFFGKMGGKSLVGQMLVAVTLYMPKWLWALLIKKMVSSRPQVSFLPLVKDTGRVKPKYQPSLHKTIEIFKKKASHATKSTNGAKSVNSARSNTMPTA